MDRKTLLLIGLVVLLSALTMFFAFAGGSDSTVPEAEQGETVSDAAQTDERVDPSTVPEVVNESKPAATELLRQLRERGHDNASVRLDPQTGEILVFIEPDARSGAGLKDQIYEVAHLYADLVGEYPETNGLTIEANGVSALVSSDAAAKHGAGDINEDALNKTIVFTDSKDE